MSTSPRGFVELPIARVSPEAAGSVAVTLAVPEAQRHAFAFEPGQFLTVRAHIAGQEVRRSYSISSAHLRYGRVYDILTHPRIVAYVRDILGENVVAWGSHFFCKMPHDGKAVAWHQDASYWPLTPSKAVTVWLAIDDADVENACMRFIAGSHHYGHMTFRPSSPGEHNVLDQTIENSEQYGTPVDDILKAGEASIHSDLLLHGSEANNSDRRRCGLTLRYAAADVRAHMDWNKKGVIVSGSDNRMVTGCSHDSNWAARIRYMNTNDSTMALRNAVAVRLSSRERPTKSARYSGPKSSAAAASAIACCAAPCDVPGSMLAFTVTCRCRPMRLMVAGASLAAKVAMLSSVTIPSRDDGTGSDAIASCVPRSPSAARRWTSYCSPASLNVVT